MEAALQQVYGARAAAAVGGGAQLREVLARLSHVRYDRASACPMAEGEILPAGLVLHALGCGHAPGKAAPLAEIVHAHAPVPTVLVCGSWS